MRCSTCQALLPQDAQFCPMCGLSIDYVATGPTTRLGHEEELRCLRCSDKMEIGFTLEIDGGAKRWRTKWVAGQPNLDIWLGDIKTQNVRAFRIWTYRCVRCGYLESYAPDGEQGEL